MTTKLKYDSWGTEYELSFQRGKYQSNGSLAIQVFSKEEGEEYVEPFCTLTVNLSVPPVNDRRAYIDTNNVPMDLIQLLQDNDICHPTGIMQTSGYCVYPEYEFSEEWLKAIKS